MRESFDLPARSSSSSNVTMSSLDVVGRDTAISARCLRFSSSCFFSSNRTMYLSFSVVGCAFSVESISSFLDCKFTEKRSSKSGRSRSEMGPFSSSSARFLRLFHAEVGRKLILLTIGVSPTLSNDSPLLVETNEHCGSRLLYRLFQVTWPRARPCCFDEWLATRRELSSGKRSFRGASSCVPLTVCVPRCTEPGFCG